MKYYICKSTNIAAEVLNKCLYIDVDEHPYFNDRKDNIIRWVTTVSSPGEYYLFYFIPDDIILYITLIAVASYNDTRAFAYLVNNEMRNPAT